MHSKRLKLLVAGIVGGILLTTASLLIGQPIKNIEACNVLASCPKGGATIATRHGYPLAILQNPTRPFEEGDILSSNVKYHSWWHVFGDVAAWSIITIVVLRLVQGTSKKSAPNKQKG